VDGAAGGGVFQVCRDCCIPTRWDKSMVAKEATDVSNCFPLKEIVELTNSQYR